MDNKHVGTVLVATDFDEVSPGKIQPSHLNWHHPRNSSLGTTCYGDLIGPAGPNTVQSLVDASGLLELSPPSCQVIGTLV